MNTSDNQDGTSDCEHSSHISSEELRKLKPSPAKVAELFDSSMHLFYIVRLNDRDTLVYGKVELLYTDINLENRPDITLEQRGGYAGNFYVCPPGSVEWHTVPKHLYLQSNNPEEIE